MKFIYKIHYESDFHHFIEGDKPLDLSKECNKAAKELYKLGPNTYGTSLWLIKLVDILCKNTGFKGVKIPSYDVENLYWQSFD